VFSVFRGLIEDPPHLSIALGVAMTVVVPALSSLPGQAPTHHARCLDERNGAAVAPTSAMPCCAQATPNQGLRGALHRIVMSSEELGHLVIRLAEVILDQTQFLQSQLAAGDTRD
jgi:hypothetical protein